MARSAKKIKNYDVNWEDFDLAEFSLVEQEVATEIAAKEKQKMLAEYELNKLIEQSGQDGDYWVRQQAIFPQSPHVLDLRARYRAKMAELAQIENNLVNLQRRSDQLKAKQSARQAKLQKLSALSKPWSNGLTWRFVWRWSTTRNLAVVNFLATIWHLPKVCLYYCSRVNKSIRRRQREFRDGWKNRQWFAFRQSFSGLGKLAFFVLTALIIALPFGLINFYQQGQAVKGRVLGASQSAVEQWGQGLTQLSQGDWAQAVSAFQQAKLGFVEAQGELETYNKFLLEIASLVSGSGSTINSGQNLITIGQGLSDMAVKLSMALDSSLGSSNDLAKKLTIFHEYLADINQDYQELQPLINEVDAAVLPDDYQPLFALWQENNNQLAFWFAQAEETLQWLLQVLGTEAPQRYLVVFQNSNELRASGGFIGSFALLDFANGEIVNLDIPGGGSYDLQGQLKEFLAAPYPQQLLGTRWQFWDANWWPDWPTVAQKLAWFYEKSGGPTVDGVWAINSSVLSSLVDYFGVIELPEYNKILTGDNVVLALQHAVEFEYDQVENQPKEIIADLAPILFDKFYHLSQTDFFSLGDILLNHLAAGDIQMYFSDSTEEGFVQENDWSGELKTAPADYLNVVVQNIGGGKTDAVIAQTIDYSLLVGADDYLIARAKVIRQHNGDPEDAFTRQRNVAFIRVYVPLGSELISIDGATPPAEELFKTIPDDYRADGDLITLEGENYYFPFTQYYETEQFGKQVFGQWLMVDQGETAEIVFNYRLPIKLEREVKSSGLAAWFTPQERKLNYSLYFEKQSGIAQEDFRFSFYLPENSNLRWSGDSFNGLYRLGDNLYLDEDIDRDFQLGFVLD